MSAILTGIRSGFATALLLMALSYIGIAQAAQPAKDQAKSQPNDNVVARGKYIVEGLAVCSQCHTPRDSSGTPDRSRWLQGGPVWLVSAEPIANWPLVAPRIAQSPPGTDAEMVKLLTTGIWRDGKQLRPPMPQFRMSVSDAEAVVAYLKSLNPAPR